MKKQFSILLLGFLQFFGLQLSAQTITPVVNGDGFQLQLEVGNSNIRSEEELTYTVRFVIPLLGTSAANKFTITLHFDPNAQITGYKIPPEYGAVNAGDGYIPNFNTTSTPGQVTLQFSQMPTPNVPRVVSSDFQVKVKMPASKACSNLPNLTAYATLVYNLPPDNSLQTSTVNTQLVVDNRWVVWKSAMGASYLGPTATAPCAWGGADNIIRYRLVIYLQNDGIVGSQNVSLNSLLDLPPSIPGITFGNLHLTSGNFPVGFSLATNGSFTLPAGFTLDAEHDQVYQLEFDMILPNNTPPQCLQNQVTAQGTDFCGATVTPISTISYFQKVDQIIQSGTVEKTAIVTGNASGCNGKYQILVRGPRPTGYTLFDVMPPCLTTLSTSVLSSVNNGGSITPSGASTFTLHSSQALSATDVDIYIINYTIGSTCGGDYTNNVTNSTGGIEATVTNYLLPDVAVPPCIGKSVCSNDGIIGGKIRFRFRVQNFSTLPMTQCKFVDDLKSIGLDYIPSSESYYYTDQKINVGDNCGGAPGVIPTNSLDWSSYVTHTYINGVLTYTFNTFNIPCGDNTKGEYDFSDCSKGLFSPAFYVEFDARILPTVGINASKNFVNITNSANQVLTAQPAEATFTVNANVNLTLKKQVSTNGGAFGNSGTAAPNDVIKYKLSVNNSGIALYQPFLIDLLPMNSGSAGNDDRFILQKTTQRGSNCNVFYENTPLPTSTLTGNVESFDDQTDLNAQYNLGSSATFGANNPNWSTPYISNYIKNLKISYPSISPLSATELDYVFSARIDMNAEKGSKACNTFAVCGFKKTMFDYLPVMVKQLPAESEPVCLDVRDADPTCCRADSFVVPDHICYNIETSFCVHDDCSCLATENQNVYTWDFGDGTPPMSTIPPNKCVSHSFAPGLDAYVVTVRWIECGEEKNRVFEIHARNCEECSIHPLFTTTISGLSVAVDASATLSNQPFTFYVWDFGDGNFAPGITATHTYLTKDCYRVTLTVYSMDGSGNACRCNEQISKLVCVEGPALKKVFLKSNPKANKKNNTPLHPGQNSLSTTAKKGSEINITATPNPFSHSLIVSLQSPVFSQAGSAKSSNLSPDTKTETYSISLLDANGAKVLTQPNVKVNTTMQIDTKTYAAGVYLLTLTGSGGILKTTRVVKINQ